MEAIIDRSWFVIEHEHIAGELITLTSGNHKYALAFTKPDLAAAFLVTLEDSTELRISELERSTLKESFLRAAQFIGATHLLFDYERGTHSAITAPLDRMLEHVLKQIAGPIHQQKP